MRLGIWAMAATAFLWSIAGLFIKVIDWNPFAIAGMRSLISSLVVLAWLRRPQFHWSLAPGRRRPGPDGHHAALRLGQQDHHRRQRHPAAVHRPGVHGHHRRLDAQGAGALGALGRLSSSSPPAWCCCSWTSSAAAGCWAMSWRFCSGLTFSFCYVFLRKQKDASPLESMLLAHWFTAAIGLARLPLPAAARSSPGRRPAPSPCWGSSRSGWRRSCSRRPSSASPRSSANLIAVIEPVFNPLWVFLALGERPGITAIAGGALIIAAVAGASVISARRTHA